VTPQKLPDYKSPPVVEIVAAIQFSPLPRFGMAEAITVARAFEGFTVVDVPPAFAPIIELPPGEPPRQSFKLDFGSPPIRLVLESSDHRWLVQLQQDRIAVHERRVKNRPSFRHVRPRVKKITAQASEALGRQLLSKEIHPPELVELIYVNRVPGDRALKAPAELHKVIKVLSGEPEGFEIEQISVGFSSILETKGGDFAGRLHVQAEPSLNPETGVPEAQIQVISRRYVHQRAWATVLGECHTDIVEGFTAVTTSRMHEVWQRYQ